MKNNADPFEVLQRILKQTFPDDETISAHLGEIMDFVKNIKVEWHADEKSRKLGIAFLNEADRDLNSCRRLYSKKTYAHSVYHLQQAVEKAVKGYCLGLGISTIEEVRVRGHDTPYVLLRATLEKTGMKPMLQSLSEDSRSRVDKAWDAIDKREKRLELCRVTFQEIKGWLAETDKNERKMNELARKLNPVLAAIRPTQPLPIFFQTLPTLARLYMLASLSFPHEEFTRYPGGEISPSEYTSRSGIVRGIPKMRQYLAPVVKELRLKFAEEDVPA